jgi:transforming growth factor-beta-induced protein
VFSSAIPAGTVGVPLLPTILCNTCTPELTAFNDGTAVTIKTTAGGSTSPALATVTTANVNCTNGVVHVVDKVLVPANKNIPTQNVAEVATANGLSSLVSALVATGLDTVLTTGNGIYTVFAPTNSAFAAVPAYISSNITLLKQVLLYHVITGRTYKENLPANANATVATLNGQSINVLSTTAPVGVTVFGNAAGNKATVVSADVDSTNAVVHVIDTVS